MGTNKSKLSKSQNESMPATTAKKIYGFRDPVTGGVLGDDYFERRTSWPTASSSWPSSSSQLPPPVVNLDINDSPIIIYAGVPPPPPTDARDINENPVIIYAGVPPPPPAVAINISDTPTLSGELNGRTSFLRRTSHPF